MILTSNLQADRQKNAKKQINVTKGKRFRLLMKEQRSPSTSQHLEIMTLWRPKCFSIRKTKGDWFSCHQAHRSKETIRYDFHAL